MQHTDAGDGHASLSLGESTTEERSGRGRVRSKNQPIGRRFRGRTEKEYSRSGPLPLEPLTNPDRTMGINSIPYPQRLEPVRIPLERDNILTFTIKSLSVTEVVSVLNRARIEDTGASKCFSCFLLGVLPIYIGIQIAMWGTLIWLYSSFRHEACRHDLTLWALIEGVTGFLSLLLNAGTTLVFSCFVDPANPTRTAVLFNWFKLVVGVFGFAWTMAGTVWTFSLARSAPSLSMPDCSYRVFLWSFIYCMFYWCVVAPLFLFMFFTILVRVRRIAARHSKQPQHLPPPSRRISSHSISAPLNSESRSINRKGRGDSVSVAHVVSDTDEHREDKSLRNDPQLSDFEEKDNDSNVLSVRSQLTDDRSMDSHPVADSV